MKQNRESFIIAVICIVQFITPFMAAGVNVALPAIGTYFSASTFQLSLAAMMYILGLGTLLLPAGQMADIFGRKKIFLTGIVCFIITSLILPFCRNIETFLAFRFFQGSSTALITTASFAILSSVIPANRRGRSMGIIIACVYAGLSAGPAIGGFLVTHLGWKYLFFFTVLFAVAALILTFTSLHGEWWGNKGQSFDFLGSVLFAFSLALLITGITSKELVGDLASPLALCGSIGFLSFLFLEFHSTSPILNVRLLWSNKTLLLTALAALLNYAASFGIIFFFSLYLQSIKGMSPQSAGFFLMLQTLVQCILSPQMGQLADKIYPGKLATIGMAICAASLALAAFVTVHSSLVFIVVIFITMGIGFGFFSSPNTTLIMNSVPKELYGMASSLTAVMRNLGMLVSMAISTSLIEKWMGHQAITVETSTAFMQSMQMGMSIFAGISIIGIFCSIGRIRQSA